MKKSSKFIPALLLIAALVFQLGCASTSSTGKSKPSGFLGDYSLLSAGGDGRANLLYIDESAQFSQYDKVLLEPVTVWRTSDANLNDLEAAELKQLTDHLYTSVHKELSKKYEMVQVAGPGTLRVRLALTEAVGANVAMNTVSSIIPIGLIGSSAKKMATGSHAFVGKASVEGEVLDSITNVRLLAAVDERAGRKDPIGGKWSDANAAFDYWAEKLASRLNGLVRAEGMKQSLKEIE
jgi:hypothetical protein